jgi:hypothetical protein
MEVSVHHKISVIHPYSVGSFILLTYWLGDCAIWVVHDNKGREMARGRSDHSKNFSVMEQARINGQAWARRYTKNEFKLLCQKGG